MLVTDRLYENLRPAMLFSHADGKGHWRLRPNMAAILDILLSITAIYSLLLFF
jgi:hypothetical protein